MRLAFGPVEKDLGITDEVDVLVIDPTGRALIVFRNIFPPEVVEHGVGVGTDVVWLSSVQAVRPAKSPGVITNATGVSVKNRIRGYDRHHEPWVTILVNFLYPFLIALVKVLEPFHVSRVRKVVVPRRAVCDTVAIESGSTFSV